MNEKISIIIPVYNLEKYIKRTAESVLKQTYTNIEVIIVDDGSSDSSGDICDLYARRDERIKVVHNFNSGVAQARNIGLKMGTGKYFMFVDSDDWIENNMCEVFYRYAKKYEEVNVIKTVGINRNSEGEISASQPKSVPLKIVDIENEFSFMEPYAAGVVWGTLYKAEILKDLAFENELYVGEDTLFLHEL